MRSTAPLPTSAYDDIEPPADWYLDDGFNMPVTKENDRRGEVLRRKRRRPLGAPSVAP
jgi:hypothetical protein